ncbi:FAD-dependent oxidoreductase [Pediococcus claussenii]|uniref:Oxidoreductase, FAD/NAD-binding domain protein n=1 Tax=Pediococcus claussenii (strain ATCC BAA-344 / DSM 14800 / JCM 18046 / KCTC 3811 / LMG 21948 / P06) TaxID=701521 RepID=G8PEX6_PEDCP|nr:FAD-dependent oxidoreductase [Pediococcus claussenii]AEV95655.1 oxidoreductase, FAD/NAD-binding domain protein [Pediococcus claussenii ATCC BAA-344]
MIKKISYVKSLVWLVLLFVVPLPLIQTIGTELPTIYSSEQFAVQLGAIAYVWFLVAIYLSTRPKWLDRLIGLPSIYFIHGILSILAILLAYVHKTQTSSAGWIKNTGNWAFDLFFAVMCYSLIFLAGWLTTRIPLLNWIKIQFEKFFKHEVSVWLHRLNIVAVILVFIHVQLISYITHMTGFILLFDAYSIIALIAYSFHKLRNARLLHHGRVQSVEEIAKNFYQVRVKIARPQKFNINAGDFVFIKFPHIQKMKELHPFSVSSAPDNNGIITLAIRGDGDFSKMVKDLDKDEVVQIDGGYGRFSAMINENPSSNLTLITGGSGIVPMVSIVSKHADKNIKVYYSAHQRENLIFLEELKKVEKSHPNIELHIQAGRFKQDEIWNTNRSSQNTLYLISGPLGLGRHWKHFLLNQGIPTDHILFEEFIW